MANHASRTVTSSHAPSPIPEVAALRPARRGGAGRTLGLLARLTAGGAGAALLLAPAGAAAPLGPWTQIVVAEGWTAAQAAGAGLLAVAGLWTVVSLLRRPRWEVRPDAGTASARTAAAGSAAAGTTAATTRSAAGRDETTADVVPFESPAAAPAPKRVDDVDPAAVRSTYSASAPATVPFPAAAVGELAGELAAGEEPAEEVVASHAEWPGEWDEEGNEPSVIRFEDVPRTVDVGGRVVDLTEMDFDGPKDEMLKGLSKKERRTVRKALRDRERMLLRAA